MKPEEKLSGHVKKWLDKLNELGVISTIHFCVPNEFLEQTKGAGFETWKKKEAMGCLAGASDWVVIASHSSCLMELKHAKTMKAAIKKLRKSQADFALDCERKGVNRYTVFDKDSFIFALKHSGVLKNQ